ncbi:MAG TPA: type II secretion system protein [Tepidisphaeraceae bacterium]|nr:type II secretion system protein [Tepidisphaeraceae bacterium]
MNDFAHQRPHAFTLVEILAVLVIIGLLVSIGIGGWNAMIGNSSVEAAQSVTGAVLGRAREEALALRKPRGVVFFERDDQRIYAATVWQNDPAGRPTQLELVPGSPIEPLQNGVSCRFISNGTPRYFVPGLLLFDGYGQISIRKFSIASAGELGTVMQLPADISGYSSLGITLFNRRTYEGIPDADKDRWLDQKGRSLFVNRYSGTLVEGRGQ